MVSYLKEEKTIEYLNQETNRGFTPGGPRGNCVSVYLFVRDKCMCLGLWLSDCVGVCALLYVWLFVFVSLYLCERVCVCKCSTETINPRINQRSNVYS